VIRRLRDGLATLALASCGLLACSSARDAETQKSAAQVARAVEVLRNAPNEMKAGPLKDLAKVRCVGPDVCATSDACRSAYQLHVDALALTAGAKEQVAFRDNPRAGKLLVSAQQKLSEASVRVADCVEREAVLRHRYKL
jgi:hypothetical protein